MKTSYFSFYKGAGGICIARGFPRWIKSGMLASYKKLAPGSWFNKVSTEEYIHLYNKEILSPLNPVVVWSELHQLVPAEVEPVILCYEKSGDFCHRQLVAKWFYDTLGEIVDEYAIAAPVQQKQITIEDFL